MELTKALSYSEHCTSWEAGGALCVLDLKLKGLRPNLDQKLKGRWRKSRSSQSFSPDPREMLDTGVQTQHYVTCSVPSKYP